MNSLSSKNLDALWARHHAEWRDSAQVSSQWKEAAEVDSLLLRHKIRGSWWETLAACGITLLVTREYEHLVMAMQVVEGVPNITYLCLPHPSGLAVDRSSSTVYVASTRNPNQIYEFQPVHDLLPRLDVIPEPLEQKPLVPVRSRFLPGCTYMHDLALIGGELYANAVGHNAIIKLDATGRYQFVWWPHCVETAKGPIFGQNHIQLNSIAAGATLEASFFSASSDKISARRPGHKNYPVNRRGVVFSAATREPIIRGLTRPHSARLHRDQVWVDNSGYGEVGVGGGERFVPVAKLPGWTRGLCFCKDIAFVGTSRVIPRFRQYAPGLEVDSSLCGIHAVDTRSGEVLGSLIWPYGNQIFAIDWLPQDDASGFPFVAGTKRLTSREKALFYAFKLGN